ncbi:MAG TPA: Wzz/FepE/Etk N-terminal domain-containing protein [Bryobacteraceae bacterium]
MLDRLSVPRRSLDFEDYIDIVRRNFRWLIGPAFAGLVISTVVAYLLQDTYVSKAIIRIVPQQISPDLVKNTSAQDVSDRINGMAQQILSRGTLTNLIETYGLYKEELKHAPMQDVVTTMHDAIDIRAASGVTSMAGTRSLPAMSIAFSYRDPQQAVKVCGDLVSRFMNASSQDVMDSQLAAYQFLKDEFERSQRELNTVEQKLTDYKQKNAGRLPDEMQSNISQMNALEQRASSLSEAATRNAERRMMLEADLRAKQDRLAALKRNNYRGIGGGRISDLEKEIDAYEGAISQMKDRYTDNYPDLQTARERLAVLKKQREEALKNADKVDEASVSESPSAERDRMEAEQAVQVVQTELKALALEEKDVKRGTAQVNDALKRYQGRIEGIPAGEMEYAELLRDRSAARQKYDEFESKLHKANVSMELERRKQGETLELLDAPSTPVAPTAPKRATIIPIGFVVGLVIGAILVGLREVKDTSLKNLKDARLYTQLSILGSIPLLENDVVVQRRKQVLWVGWATATILGLAIMAGSVARYYWSKA